MRHRLVFLLLCGFMCAGASGQELTLEDCRALAIANNKALKEASADERKAYWERRSAITKYLPQISAAGGYMHTGREISLLSSEQKTALPVMLGPVIGGSLVESLHTDTRDMGAVGVMLTQPVFMGGKIVAYNKLARDLERIAGLKRETALEEVIVEVDEAYWQCVSLSAKRDLALKYKETVGRLCDDVSKMVEAGVATKADLLSVRVKLNEAEVTVVQVENGLQLTKLLLWQICGIEEGEPVGLEDLTAGGMTAGGMAAEEVKGLTAGEAVEMAMAQRGELKQLTLLDDVMKQKVRIARGEYLPQVALTGGYFATNPSVYNGFHKHLEGTWAVGVMVNVPLITWGDRLYKVRAAKAEREKVQLQLDEAREKISLQVRQCELKTLEAEQRLAASRSSVESADENLRYATLGLQEGVIPVSNVMEAQTAWVKAQSELIASQIDARLADLYLRKATGNIKQ